jgi:predicted glycoside hydrolase/deacetylase ChbG (UPF0249 family)
MSSSLSKAIHLIINADDFGYCPNRDAAIIDLLEQKLISSASLLVNGFDADQAAQYAKMHDVPIGIHLNLTEGRPVTNDVRRIESLVNADGFMHGKFGLRHKLREGRIQLEHVENEIEMQLNKYKELTGGIPPNHIDGHQHIHVHPAIVESVARLAHRYGIKYVRAPQDPMIISSEMDQSFHSEIVTQTKSAVSVFDRYALNYSKYFFGMTTMGRQLTLENVENCLKVLAGKQAENVVAELMCHPGYPSDPFVGGCGTGYPDTFSQSADRQHEFDVLSSRELRALFKKYNVQLCAYADIS